MQQSKYLRDEESIEMMDEYIYTNIGFGPISGGSMLNTTLTTAKKSTARLHPRLLQARLSSKKNL